jgi:hypothetical protein
MVHIKITLTSVDALLGVDSNAFMGLQVCLCLRKYGAMSRIIAPNVFVEP